MKLKTFFLFCSGIDQNILAKCPSDENKYVGIGATVFFTGVLAFLSAGYALFTVFDSPIAALLFGVIWGAMIFNLDRYIVSSMKSKGSWWRDFLVAFPRLLMAVLLALVISKPLELKIFEKEINSELVIVEQEIFKTQEDKVRNRYTSEIEANQLIINDLKKEIEIKTATRDTLFKIAQMEADGTGGSRQRSLGPIYQLKKADADQAQSELDALLQINLPQIDQKESEIAFAKSQINQNIQNLERTSISGLAGRMDALDRLTQKSSSIWFANFFITLLFITIETAPIFVKLISSRSPYDYLLDEHEHVFAMANKKRTSLLSNEIKNLIFEKTEIKTHGTKAKVNVQKARINAQLKKELDKLKEEHGSLDDVVFDL